MNGETFSLKKTALQVCLDSIRECAPDLLVRRYFSRVAREVGLDDFLFNRPELFLLSIGKAAVPMALAAGESLGWNRIEGLVVTGPEPANEEISLPLPLIRGGHPFPDENSILAGRTAIEKLGTLKPSVPALFLVSGGASSLFECPQEGIALEDLRELTGSLLRSGASIQEINKVRVGLSRVKGGRLLESAGRRETLTLILSDVVGDDLEAVGSGPTVVRTGNVAKEAIEVLKRHHLWVDQRPKIRDILELEAEKWEEREIIPQARVELVGNNRLLCETAIRKLGACGFNTLFLGSSISGEASETGRFMADLAREILVSGNPVPLPAAVVSGGETVVTFHGKKGGVGGPNQEVALSFAIRAAGLKDTVLVSMDTDGIDGPTPNAGGAADGLTFQIIKDKGADPCEELERHNAAGALMEASALVMTGSTGNNLNDLRILLVGKPEKGNIPWEEGEKR